MSSNLVSTRIDPNGVATVELNRPEVHNAFDDAMIAELLASFEQLAADRNTRVVVLASQGKNFSAGADLNWMRRMADYDYADNLADARALAAMLQALSALPQPTIARVQGAVFGGAVGLVACCDIALAEEAASFCLSEVKIGLIPATISPYVIAAMGARAARRYFTTAERFPALEAHRLGLVSEVVANASLDETVERVARQILNNGPQAVRAAKQLVTAVSERPVDDDLIEDTCDRIARIRVSEEGQEGLSAFLDKRPPRWQED